MSYQPEPKPPPYNPQPYATGQYVQAPYGPPPLNPQQLAARQHQQDSEHLQLLSICYYVLAGLAMLGACIPLLYFGIGLAAVLGGTVPQNSDPIARSNAATAGSLVMVLATPFVLLLVTQVALLLLTGRYLSQGRNYMFCFINACVICMHAPLGTALGVFTIVVLGRESVKQRFAANNSGHFPPPPTFQKY
jgi:hypothetical protein